MDDEGRNPIDFGSLGNRSRSTLPPCKGMPRFALSSSFMTFDSHIFCPKMIGPLNKIYYMFNSS